MSCGWPSVPNASVEVTVVIPGSSHSHGCFFYSHVIDQKSSAARGESRDGIRGRTYIELGLVQPCSVHSAHIFSPTLSLRSCRFECFTFAGHVAVIHIDTCAVSE